MSFIDKLTFSQNWNGKLDCTCFTTLRLRNDKKYFVGKQFEIWLKQEYKGRAQIVDIKYLLLDQISDWIARLDTGYNAEKCKDIIRTMYQKSNLDWSKQQFCYVILEKLPCEPLAF